MDSGYTLLWRKTWKNKVLQEKNKRFSRLEAWLYLVNVKAQGVPRNGLQRGEFEASYRYLAGVWNWSVDAVYRFMKILERERMILRPERYPERKAEHQPEHFIICSYETYNSPPNTNPNAKPNATPNKVKEGERRKKEGETSQAAGAAAVDPFPSAESIRLSEVLRTAIVNNDQHSKAARLPDLTHWARDIEKLITTDVRRTEDIEKVIAWCQKAGCFWSPIIRSGRKLRENYEAMLGQMRRNGNGKSHKPNTVGLYDPSRDPKYKCQLCTDFGLLVVLSNKETVPFDGDEAFWGAENIRRCTCEAGKPFPQLELWRPDV